MMAFTVNTTNDNGPTTDSDHMHNHDVGLNLFDISNIIHENCDVIGLNIQTCDECVLH